MNWWQRLFHAHTWRFYCADCVKYGRHTWPSRARWHCECGATRDA